jgi:pullulanase/glycogen debranching enzyme
MASNFIVNSLCWWAKEYQIKGFRFDVMGVLDGATHESGFLGSLRISIRPSFFMAKAGPPTLRYAMTDTIRIPRRGGFLLHHPLSGAERLPDRRRLLQ